MKELEIIQQLERTLTHPQIPAIYVQGDLEWLKRRSLNWTRSSWRIGVLGVTSSGKSTLINAFCGEEILPQEARPTSGVLVSCKKSKMRKGTLIRKNGSTSYFNQHQLNKEIIAKYADELNNPGNKEQVDEICLEFPDFLVGNNIEIVDSPGLDAFGLEGHEEIALRQLVPTVDLVLYLTTTKANSDQANLQALNQIASEHKPVIIAQNFIDCVTPEFTSGGSERRTSQEVEQRLRQRIEKILKETSNKSLRNAPVFQISALEGLKSKGSKQGESWKKSRLEPLLLSIHSICEQMEGQRSQRRLHQLLRHLNEIKERAVADLATYNQDKQITTEVIGSWDATRKQIEAFHDEAEQASAHLDAEIQKGRRQLSDQFAQIRNQYIKLDAERISENEVHSSGKSLKDIALQVQKNVLQLMDTWDSKEKKLLHVLNLALEDVRSHRGQLVPDETLKVYKETKTKITTRTEKKSNGFLGLRKLKRWIFSESDYETITTEEEISVVNIRKTLEEFQVYLNRFDKLLEAFRITWQQQKEKGCLVIKEEAMRRDEIIAARRNKPKDAKVLEDFIHNLELIEEKGYGRRDRKEEEPELNFELPFVEHPVQALNTMTMSYLQFSMSRSLFALATEQKRIYAQAIIWNHLKSHSGVEVANDLWFFGKDQQWMEQAFTNIFGIQPQFTDNETVHVRLKETKLPIRHAFLTTSQEVDENIQRQGVALIQLDIHQLGVTQKLLAGQWFLTIMKSMPFVFVIQSIQEYIQDAGLAMAYKSYRQLMDFASIQNPSSIVIHDNPLYTALFHTADQFAWQAGKGEEQDALRQLFTQFPRLDHAKNRNEAGQFFKEISLTIRS
ncbi:dynamin family protein [Brevibacillus centrosporus]|uniref:dynamin family protein n=1 Tax=Brevibacillus centrosporus TaxID=54910 RepID=UPI000F09FB5D|nr:dynamin family protein [Brevibacillus centrosporus]MEC2130240.1 dynamin family protein [Brevibacillus centrosporus]RNB70956.1 hypothetical protein EDM55_09230 [Brevibacillus centrosporus]GED30270.1 hypothetical protein BCE02nite_14110 [Brevibacillus centrosporus]